MLTFTKHLKAVILPLIIYQKNTDFLIGIITLINGTDTLFQRISTKTLPTEGTISIRTGIMIQAAQNKKELQNLFISSISKSTYFLAHDLGLRKHKEVQ